VPALVVVKDLHIIGERFQLRLQIHVIQTGAAVNRDQAGSFDCLLALRHHRWSGYVEPEHDIAKVDPHHISIAALRAMRQCGSVALPLPGQFRAAAIPLGPRGIGLEACGREWPV
jgi:hypothetical protein